MTPERPISVITNDEVMVSLKSRERLPQYIDVVIQRRSHLFRDCRLATVILMNQDGYRLDRKTVELGKWYFGWQDLWGMNTVFNCANETTLRVDGSTEPLIIAVYDAERFAEEGNDALLGYSSPLQLIDLPVGSYDDETESDLDRFVDGVSDVANFGQGTVRWIAVGLLGVAGIVALPKVLELAQDITDNFDDD